MKKKVVYGLAALSACVMLSGCHFKHEWQEATCTQPRTCTVGGETKGEPLGHTWEDATCAKPKTCSVCKETEGEALEHTWEEATCIKPKTCSVCKETEGEALGHDLTEANYQSPAVCRICGETEGEPLVPWFEEHGIVCDAKENETYDYTTYCWENKSVKTTGHLVFSDYKTFESDEDHPAKDGYEWKSVHAVITFDDDNAFAYGMQVRGQMRDYYAVDEDDDENWEGEDQQFSVNFNGVDYEECIRRMTGGFDNWVNQVRHYDVVFDFLLPKGYDGQTVSYYSSEFEDQEVAVILKNSICFRLN